ncbi:MAG: hypothetical protein V4638_06235 [Bacteroidota bacterium]
MEAILENKKNDRFYLIYSSLAGFLLIGFYYLLRFAFSLGLEASFLITFLLFTVFFDIRHLFPTYSRTLFDRHFMTENRKWFHLAWIIILFFPIIGFVLLSQGEFSSYNSYIVFGFMIRATYVLGFYHLVKQNWGFMAIYKKKFGEPEDGSDRWEKIMLISGAFISFVYLSKLSPVWFNRVDNIAFNPPAEQLQYVLEFWEKIAISCCGVGLLFIFIGFALKVVPQFKKVSQNVGFLFLGFFIIIKWILEAGKDPVLNFLLIALIVLFVLSSAIVIRRTVVHKIYNKEKFLVLISSLILYNGIALIPLENIHLFAMAVTFPHNIQYLRFVNVFNKRYYENSKNDHGFAKVLATKTLLFFALSLIYSVVFEAFRTGIASLPIYTSSFDYFRNLISVLFLGIVLHHYFLDAVIWRVRKDKDLSEIV